MDKLKNALVLQLVGSPSTWTDQRRMSSIASIVLLLAKGDFLGGDWSTSFKLLGTVIDGIKDRRYQIDSKLIYDLYISCPSHLKLALADSAAFLYLEPRTFKTLFLDAYRRRASTFTHRRDLAITLSGYLISFHPERANEYEDIILELLRSRKPDLRRRGLYMAGLLNDLEVKDLQLMKKYLSSKSRLRIHAMNGLCELVKRRKTVSPRVRTFCMDSTILAKAKHINETDRDDDARLAAHYLLQALREDL